MIVISDTTPIITLSKIKRLDLLQKLFGKIMIPQAVYNGLTSSTQFRDEADAVNMQSILKKCLTTKYFGDRIKIIRKPKHVREKSHGVESHMEWRTR